MPLWANWLIAIGILVALLVIFIVSFVLYRKTPVPKGCEDLERTEEKCAACSETGCRFNLYYGREEEKEKEALFKAGEENKEETLEGQNEEPIEVQNEEETHESQKEEESDGND